MAAFDWLNSTFNLLGLQVKWSDFIGNLLALATVWLALRRMMIAWPVQILGSILLFIASVSAQLGGNAARQVVIVAAAAWGWSRWRANKADAGEIQVRWASWSERALLVVAMIVGTLAFGWVLHATNASFFPGAPWHLVLADSWIFVGSVLAMYSQARRVVEFWFVWLAVDVIGVPLAWTSGLYFSGIVYGIFFVLVIIGIFNWAKHSRDPLGGGEVSATGTSAAGPAAQS